MAPPSPACPKGGWEGRVREGGGGAAAPPALPSKKPTSPHPVHRRQARNLVNSFFTKGVRRVRLYRSPVARMASAWVG